MRPEIIPVIVASASIVAAPFAVADPTPDSPEAQAILQPALAAIASELGKPAKLDVKTLRTSGDWAYVDAKLQEANGQPISYQDTKYAEAAENGGVSHSYDGLLRRGADGQWTIVASVVGPTDVPSVGWSQQYGAPTDLFPPGH
jgi:ketosteroid isomerase-like protein